ncbi:MAG: hypothetical protein OXH27_03555 [Gammaproteobacteria bacterium]|nr:hypothetical protein [Gammaproteobacteria bacterium]MCY3690207.1 hypothetical protein [Gammaproteobacteria bacterium]MDE0507818.1 hypothetical protein [Gammaproteobacteria bacterium]MYA36353.1 hypothetical protein [Gammaproteobacteria bacterium]MYF00955.1 hypothetical protein [Gammaproteobacteria bacterium]
MNELISLAKENAFVVIGLLLVTIYLQDRIHDETSTLRQEMRDEFTGVRQEMADFGERLARIETLVEQLLMEKQGQ